MELTEQSIINFNTLSFFKEYGTNANMVVNFLNIEYIKPVYTWWGRKHKYTLFHLKSGENLKIKELINYTIEKDKVILKVLKKGEN